MKMETMIPKARCEEIANQAVVEGTKELEGEIRVLRDQLHNAGVETNRLQEEVQAQKEANKVAMLTSKQREAVVQVARGETSEHAAVILDMDVHAYRDRVRKAKAALGAKNAAHLVALAMARGIITRKDLT